MSFGKKERTLDVRMYTAKEVIEKLREIHAEISSETAEEDGGQMALVELIVGAKLIAKLEEKMKSGEF